MSPRLLATATRALRESGSREIPNAALRITVVGYFRRQMIAVMLSILAVPLVSKVFDLGSKPYLTVFLTQLVIVVLLGTVLCWLGVRTVKGDPTLHGARAGLIVVTAKGLRLFSGSGLRRTPAAALTLDLDELAFAHVEPRRSIFDLPRFVFGHLGGAMSYEIAGKDVLQLRHAIERLEESADL